MEAQELWLAAGWAVLHLIGVTAALISRWSVTKRTAFANQFVFVFAFVAIATLAAIQTAEGFHLSLLSATTLGVMVLAAVFESHPQTENRVLTEVLAAYE